MARKGAWLGTERGGPATSRTTTIGRVSRASARPQTTREEEMSLFGRPNAKPRGQIGKGLDVAA